MNCLPALVLETSTPRASLVRVLQNGTLEQKEFSSDRSHNALLFNPLGELLGEPSENLPALVLVGSGPGSYSGTRVGIAAAQGVAIAARCPAIAVPSILAVPSAENGKKCLAVGDARRGAYWTARISGNLMETKPELTDAAGFAKAVSAALAAGESIFSFEEAARYPLPAELLSRIQLEIPDATRLWHVWQAADGATRAAWAAEVPQPLYLKPPHITPAKRSWLTVS